MTRDEFVARWGGVYEHSPWVAERAWDGGLPDGADPAPAFRRVVDRAGPDVQRALLCAHPDLAGRLALADLTPQSAAEQTGAGLDRCTPDELAEFQALNARYVARFGFPFIIAVKGLDRAAILQAFRRRVEGEPADEFRTALGEVHKIAAFRIAALSERPAPPREPIPFDALHALIAAALQAAGADAPNAAAVADTVAAAERDGSRSHGIFRVPAYAAALRSGLVNGRARPQERPGPAGAVLVDGDRGFASMGYAVALPLLAARAADTGAAVLALRNTNHFAAMWHEVEWLAEQGLAAFACTANFPYLAPHGGTRPVFGTNPIGFAYPRPSGPPVVMDFAASALARGDVMLAAREGRPVPPGTGLDTHGRETTDPAAVLQGAQLPFGGHKGSAVALMVELLAAGVVGDLFSTDAAAIADGSGVPPGGVFLLALDPERIGGPGTLARADAWLARLAEEPGVRLPGLARQARRDPSAPVLADAASLQALRALVAAGAREKA